MGQFKRKWRRGRKCKEESKKGKKETSDAKKNKYITLVPKPQTTFPSRAWFAVEDEGEGKK
jgi:hypothetical protein